MSTRACSTSLTVMLPRIALSAFLVSLSLTIARGGVTNGNGQCYGTDPPDGAANVGKHCGKGVDPKGQTTTVGQACECNNYITFNPHPLDGIDLIPSSLAMIDGITLPLNATGLLTVQMWTGSSYVDIGQATPGVPFSIPGGLPRVRVKDIQMAEDIDLSNHSVFPVDVSISGGGPFVGTLYAFAATMPIVLWQQTPNVGGVMDLAWVGGSGPFSLQSGPTPSGPWSVAPLTDERTATITPSSADRFYRVAGTSGMMSNTVDSFSLTAAFCLSGTHNIIACPCSNTGILGNGCDNSAGTGGAQLSAIGTPTLTSDTLVFTSTGELPSALSILFQGDGVIPSGLVFGDGVRCAGGSLKRLYAKAAVAGSIVAPQGNDLPVSLRAIALGDALLPGAVRYYQVYYRDPNPAFCPNPPGNTWNTSSAILVQWGP